MNKKVDKLKKLIRVNQEIYIFLLGLFVIAVIAGAIYVVTLNKSDNSLVQETLSSFFSNVENNKLNYFAALKNSFFVNIGFIITIWLLGISVIGIPIILFLFFSKSFIIGFSITSIIAHYKLKGILISFFYIFPHQIINTFAFIFLIIYSIVLSITIIETIIKKKSMDFKPIINRYLNILLITSVLVIIGGLMEVFLSPILLKLVLKI